MKKPNMLETNSWEMPMSSTFVWNLSFMNMCFKLNIVSFNKKFQVNFGSLFGCLFYFKELLNQLAFCDKNHIDASCVHITYQKFD